MTVNTDVLLVTYPGHLSAEACQELREEWSRMFVGTIQHAELYTDFESFYDQPTGTSNGKR